jgi:hypothetical protein
MGKDDAARADYQKAIELDPSLAKPGADGREPRQAH